MTTELQLYDENKSKVMIREANNLSKSLLIPQSLRKKPYDVLAILKMGDELGLKHMQSLNLIHVIKGKPSIGPQGMIALIRKSYPDARIKIDLDEEKLIARCTMSRCQVDEDPFTSTWDMKKARDMELTGKDNYRKQPMNMLKWRSVSDAARTVFPDVINGLYTPDELEDFDNSPRKQSNDDQYDKHLELVENESQEPRPEQQPKEPLEDIDMKTGEITEKEQTHPQQENQKHRKDLGEEIIRVFNILISNYNKQEYDEFMIDVMKVNNLRDLADKSTGQLQSLLNELRGLREQLKNRKASFKLDENNNTGGDYQNQSTSEEEQQYMHYQYQNER